MQEQGNREQWSSDRGFSLIEVMIAMVLTLAVMGSVYGLLIRGQEGFHREPQIADLNQSARVGLDSITRDLTLAGYKTPNAQAIWWNDGGGITPDEITIVYADPEIPISEPIKCDKGPGVGPCKTINRSSTLNIDPLTLDPLLADATQAYDDGMILIAMEKGDCNEDEQMGFYPFEVTQPPTMTSAGGSPTLQINHNPGNDDTGINFPGGFNYEVSPDCAVIGLFHVVQYRVSPLPPTPNPQLERRDLSTGEPWMPVAHNIENLQVQYSTAMSGLIDTPAVPTQDDPMTWITRVRVTVFGRTESTKLKGASQGVYSPADTHLRKSFSTAVSPRNQSYQAGLLTSAQAYN